MPQAKSDYGSSPPEVDRSKSSIELYRSVHGKYSWRVIVVADDNSAEALREAQALAIELHNEFLKRSRGQQSSSS